MSDIRVFLQGHGGPIQPKYKFQLMTAGTYMLFGIGFRVVGARRQDDLVVKYFLVWDHGEQMLDAG